MTCRPPRVLALALAGAAYASALAATACTTTSDAAPAAGDPARIDDTALPAWLGAPRAVVRAPELEEAAALLCARDTDAVIDDEARHAARVYDGQLTGLLERAATADAARAALAKDAGALLLAKRATHAGVVVGSAPSGQACAALVGARRLVALGAAPPVELPAGGPVELAVRVPEGSAATLFVLKPDGFVDRRPLAVRDAKLTIAAPLEGRYVVEIVVDTTRGESDPEVALLWPVVVGKAKDAPFPEVLFPDAGHDDVALTHRAEALVQRLRTEEQIEPFKVSPPLVDVAVDRAKRVAGRGALGHRIDGVDVAQDLHAKYATDARAQFVKLAEVQAQASTLADAWQALLDSPAHRFVLVDTSFTHCGVAVARGSDAAGRATVTMIALLARRTPSRDPGETRETFFEEANDARDKRGLAALQESARLNETATRLANAMRDAKKVDDALLGGPVAQVALEADSSLSHVVPLVSRVDDPLALLTPVPRILLDQDATHAGVGVALDAAEGVFYVAVLAGE